MPFSLPKLTVDTTPNESERNTGWVTLVVVHDTEGDYAGAVSWLKNPESQSSAHVVISEAGNTATQLVPWEKKAWACAAYNSVSDNIEMVGTARKGYPDKQLRYAARVVAFRLHKRGLPPTHVLPKGPSNRVRGFTYHSDLGEAGGGHHDPGFTKARAWWFDKWVKFEYYRGRFRKDWGV